MGNVKNPIRTLQTDFRSGEVDPLLLMRTDSGMYPSGAKSLKNCILRSGGSVSRRPGTTRLANLGSVGLRLIPFEFDIDEKYLIALSAARMDIYDGSGTLITSFTSQPWTTLALAKEVTYAQAGDTMILCQESFMPRVLRRTSLTTFSLTTLTFDKSPSEESTYQPYTKYEAANVTIEPSATTKGATIDLTASAAIFSAAWVGDVIRIGGKTIDITGYTSSTVVQGVPRSKLKYKLDPNPLLSADSTLLIKVTHPFHGLTTGQVVKFSGIGSGTDMPGGITASNLNGNRTITVIDEDHYSFNAGGGSAVNSVDFGGPGVEVEILAPFRNWDEQVFSARRGWPSAVCFHEDRLWFGGSTTLPDGLFASKTGYYYNFSVGKGEDDASIQVTVGAPRIAKIRHILAGRLLQVFADGGEFVARQSDGVALTPATVSVRPQTPFGCNQVRPMSFDGATLFVQGNNKTVREFIYDFNQDGFGATDLTTLSAHLLTSIVDADVLYGSSSRTEQYAFFVNADGTMAVFHSNRAEKLAGWLPWETVDGTFENVCVLGPKVFVVMNRGGTRVLEKIELDDNGVLLDWAITQTSGSATPNWSLGAAYAGQTLHVTSNGWYFGTVTADGSGNIVTPFDATTITAGLSYDWEVIPLPPDMQLPEGPMTGETRRIVSANIHMLNTLALSVNGQDIVVPQIGFDPSIAPIPISKKVKRWLAGYGRDPAVTLTQSAPLSVTILGMTLEVSL